MKPAAFTYHRASSALDAVDRLTAGAGGARPCSGTQSLGPMLNLRLAQVEELVDLSRIEALRGHRLDEHRLHIGAATTHAQIEDGALPDTTLGLLPAVAAGIAYRAVRNRGTLGGSLAHADPKADWLTTMGLLGARLTVLGPAGERELAMDEFLRGPFTTALAEDELLTGIAVPRLSPQARWAYRKTCRKPGEFAEAIVALLVDPPRGVARAVLGALDGLPQVIDGATAVEALRRAEGRAASFDAGGLHDEDTRALHEALLRAAFDDLDRFPGRRA